jgi:diguanylate cyclase (GGDEF)-like protein/PAS domain S-box-containing protein
MSRAQAGERSRPSLGDLRHRAFFFMIPTTAVAFWLLRSNHLIASVPLWVLGGLLAVGFLTGQLVDRSYNAHPDQLHANLRLATEVLSSTAVMYATGWGPMLAIGYVVAVQDTIATAGSAAWKRSAVWCAIGLGLGQGAIAVGVAPSFVHQPAVHGLAVLVLLGLIFVIRFVGMTTAEKERAEAEMRTSEDRFRSLVHNSSDVIAILDEEAKLSYMSEAIERITGFTPEHYLGTSALDFPHPDDMEKSAALIAGVLEDPTTSAAIELRIQTAEGDWRWVEATITNLLAHPSVRGLVANVHDVTERRLLEARLQFGAYHDALTGLPNRRAFLERMDEALARARRQGTSLAVLFCDLDRFKVVNDSLGHVAGDQLLEAVARRLSGALREEDLVARFAGDEFAILLEESGNAAAAAAGAERVLQCLRAPVMIEGRPIKIAASIGITVSDGQHEPGDLLRQADLAMYSAKGRGGGGWAMFDTDLEHKAVEHMTLEAALWQAAASGQLITYFQPEIDIQSGAITGAEALVRWQHPVLGIISPDVFIPIAEESDLILSIDRVVLHAACEAMARWQELGLDPSFAVSVNLSSRWFREVERVNDVIAVVAACGLAPDAIQLEITERVALGDDEQTRDAVDALRRAGLRIAIDDFGTGYSSMAYLTRFHVDAIKVDQSFVGRIDNSDGDAAIVQAMVMIGRALGARIVAEGVERPDQLELLRQFGCDAAQGYLFSRPVPADEMAAMLVTGSAATPAPDAAWVALA